MNDKTFTIPCTQVNLPDDETPIAFRPPIKGERIWSDNGSGVGVCQEDAYRFSWIILAPKDQPAPEPAEQPAEENVLILRNPPKPLEGFELVDEWRKAEKGEMWWHEAGRHWRHQPTIDRHLVARPIALTGQDWVDSLEVGTVFNFKDHNGKVHTCKVTTRDMDANVVRRICFRRISNLGSFSPSFLASMSDETCTILKP